MKSRSFFLTACSDEINIFGSLSRKFCQELEKCNKFVTKKIKILDQLYFKKVNFKLKRLKS